VITVVDGEQSAGKSSLLFDVIARVTTGRGFPRFDQAADEGNGLRSNPTTVGGPGCDGAAALSPSKVLLLALEDPVTTIVTPRLQAAGGALANVVISRKTEALDAAEGVAQLQLPRDFDLLAAECRELRPQLIVIDSLSTALEGGETGRPGRPALPSEPSHEQGMRGLLGRLKDLAEDYQTAVVLIRRLKQAPSVQALRRGRGGAAIPAQARTALLVAADPLAPESQVLAMVKSNLEAAPPSVRFEASGAPIRWLGPSDLNAEDLTKPADPKKLPTAVESAMYFLKTTLFEPHPYTWPELTERAATENIAEITLRRARQELKLIKTPRGPNCFVWSLPPEIMDEMHQQARLSGWRQ
jgi:hypothetical protein